MFRILTLCCVLTLMLVEANRDLLVAKKRLDAANNRITGEFLYQGAKRNPGEIYTSALYPILVAAGQLALFCKETTCDYLLNFLNLKDKAEIHALFPTIRKIFFDEPLIGLPSLNLNVYADEGNKFCKAFTQSYYKTFGGKTRLVDYSDPVGAAKEINNEVKEEGSGNFKSLISSKMIKEGAGLHFVSTYEQTIIYDDKFIFKKNVTIKFKSGRKVTNVPGITGEGIVKYADLKDFDAKSYELVGERGLCSYLILVPNKPDGLLGLLDKLRSPTAFGEILERGEEVCAKISILYRDLIAKVDLGKSARESNYLEGAFQEGGLQLRGVSQNCNNTYISSVLHEVSLKSRFSNGYKASKCSKFDVELVTNRPHLYFVTYTKKVSPIRTPVVGVVVDLTTN
ncbi:alaserpin-like [Bombyx mandarina]|uniref:Alaserpin-like n=1 Tax=Bombyx mandarina TaxID=7092 RepID=A0A6J2JWN5_BOMMA|nr:alaserpin-like [Bombyx mandarina]